MPQTKNNLDYIQVKEQAGKFINGKPVNLEALTPDELTDLFNELQVYQIQLDIQNKQILKIQEELCATNDKYTSLYNFAPVGYITIDKNGIITDGNITSSKMLGYDRINLLMKPLTNFINQDDLDAYYTFYNDLLREHSIVSCELRLMKKDGSLLWTKLEGQFLYVSDKNAILFHVVISDISANKQAEEKIKHLNDNLEKRVAERTKQLSIALDNLNHEITIRKKTEDDLRQAKDDISRAYAKEKELNELKTRLINMIQHEYKTPLTIILGSTDLIDRLYRADKKDKIQHYIETIRTSVDDMTRLLEDTLTLGDTESGQIKFSANFFDIVILCRKLAAEIDLVDSAQHDIVFSTNVDSCKMMSDETIIRKVLINLMTNALKFSGPGTDIEVELIDEGSYVNIKVKDSGIGIPEEDVVHLFEPFHRGRNTETIPGTGLGLAIVKSCLNVLKGSISISSKMGEGTTFTIMIPK